MKQFHLFKLIVILTLFFITNSKDNNFSKYEKIRRAYLTELFKSDFNEKKDKTFSFNSLENKLKEESKSLPIMELDLIKNQCSFSLNEIKLEIVANNYSNFSDSLGKINIDNEVFLESESNKTNIPLNCFLDKTEQYCLFKKNNEKIDDDTYRLNVPKEIKTENYTIKIHKGEKIFKLYMKEKEVVINEIHKEYEIDCGDDVTLKNLSFLDKLDEKNYNVKYNKDKIITHDDKKSYIESIKENLCIDNNNLNGHKKYELKLFDLCEVEKFSFYVNVKNSNLAIIIIISIGFFVFIIISIYIYKNVHKKKKLDDIQELSKEIVSEE